MSNPLTFRIGRDSTSNQELYFCNDELINSVPASSADEQRRTREMLAAIANLAGLASVGEGFSPHELPAKTMNEYRVMVYAMKHEGFVPTIPLSPLSTARDIQAGWAEYNAILTRERDQNAE